MFIGERGCANMRALCAQTCAQHYISSIGAQTAGLNETPIGTNTHWGNRHTLWESACAVHAPRAIMAAQSTRASAKWENEREAQEYMNGTWRCSRPKRDA
jgi:hypothetical protein